MKYIVGLTGGIGSGKTTVTEEFSKLGVDIIDADEVSRSLLNDGSPALTTVLEHFGQSILTKQGKLDRSQLRKIIFSNPEEKKWLEALLHPMIRSEIGRLIDTSESIYLILSAPLLLESGQYNFINRTLVIDAPIEAQIERVTQRDKVTAEETNRVIDAQMSRKDRLARADDVIINDKDIQQLKQQVLTLHDYYQRQSQHQTS